MKPIDIKGKRFGRLKVVWYDPTSKGTGHAKWVCVCKCNTFVSVRASHLKTGNVTSCGCRSREVSSKWLKEYASGPRHKGAANPSWKGEYTKYAAIHTWLSKHFKKVLCFDCGKKSKLDWSLQKGKKHGHDIKRYRSRCRSCHIRYDRKP